MASHQETDTMRGEHASTSSTGGDGDSGILRCYTEEEAKVSLPETDGSDFKTMVTESASISKPGDEEHLTSSSGNDKRNESRSNDNKSLQKKVRRTKEEDYDSVLSSFDDYAAGKGKGEGSSFAHGYEVGDMVWGKVKSHPWWPGHIYDESLASPSVRRSKGEGHVLVAFFGDSSYGWFDPAELIRFEENFDEKSRQTPSRSFVIAVEEAVDELSRRRSVGLVCRCRNQFNFWPSGVEGHLVVDVGDYEPGSYSLRQIKDARDSFQPKEMVSFIQQLALTPMDDQHKTIQFMKNKATVLACRKSLYEEFDETYAQAFGTVPVRPPRPTAPVSVDPSKAPLTGRLVIAETLGKGKVFAKPMKTKEQLEKDKYLFKRRDEPSRVKPKKALGSSSQSLFLDGSGLSGRVTYSGQADKSSEAGVTDHEQQTTSPHPPMVVAGGSKKAKAKRPVGELSSENTGLFEKKKKKKHKREISTDLPQAPVSGSSTAKMESVSRKPVQVPLVDNNIPVYVVEKSLSSPMETQPDVKTGKFELADLVRDLRSLALDPFYGMHRGCAAIAQRVFWKYRSLVYKKSLILTPPADNEASEAGKLPASFTTVEITEKSALKPVRPLGRPDDPTKGGRKRGPVDRVEGIKKKKKINDEEVKNKKKQVRLDSGEIVKTKPKEAEHVRLKKKSSDSEEVKKRKIDDSKTSAGEKKNVLPTLPKASKPESGKRVPNPTMLVMRFPSDAGLPSGAELRAKFTRFGPMDHSATRIFWTTYQCRLVYHYKADAEAALKFCNGSSILFGNSNVKCHIRELAAEVTDAEPNKGPQEEPSSQPTLRISGQSQQPKVQLKSCLKKPVGDESGNGNGRGGSRVKFALGGEESSNRSEPVTEGDSGSGSYSTMDAVSKNIPSSVPQLNIASAPPPVQFPHFAGNMPIDHRQRSFNPPPFPQMPVAPQAPNDISQQMLNLLMRCSHVVNNVRGVLGYMPYHPL